MLLTLLCGLFLSSCSDDDNDKQGTISPVSAVECSPFYGSVILKWQNPTEPDYYYTLITYTNSAGETVNRKISCYSADASGVTSTILPGFTDENPHTFTLTACGHDGATSAPVTVSGAAMAVSGAAQYVLDSVTFTPYEGGVTMQWTNNSGIGVEIYVCYTNVNGMYIEDYIDANTSGTNQFTDLGFGDTEFTVYALIDDDSDNPVQSSTKLFTCAPSVDPRDVFHFWYDFNRTSPVNFDYGVVGMTIEQLGEGHYRMVMDTNAAERYIVWEPLGSPLRRTDMALSFEYKSSDNCALTLIYYPFDWGTIGQNYHNLGELWQANDWRTVTFDLESKITSLPVKWGDANSQMRFQFTNDGMLQVGTPLTFEIRNVVLRPTAR